MFEAWVFTIVMVGGQDPFAQGPVDIWPTYSQCETKLLETVKEFKDEYQGVNTKVTADDADTTSIQLHFTKQNATALISCKKGQLYPANN